MRSLLLLFPLLLLHSTTAEYDLDDPDADLKRHWPLNDAALSQLTPNETAESHHSGEFLCIQFEGSLEKFKKITNGSVIMTAVKKVDARDFLIEKSDVEERVNPTEYFNTGCYVVMFFDGTVKAGYGDIEATLNPEIRSLARRQHWMFQHKKGGHKGDKDHLGHHQYIPICAEPGGACNIGDYQQKTIPKLFEEETFVACCCQPNKVEACNTWDSYKDRLPTVVEISLMQQTIRAFLLPVIVATVACLLTVIYITIEYYLFVRPMKQKKSSGGNDEGKMDFGDDDVGYDLQNEEEEIQPIVRTPSHISVRQAPVEPQIRKKESKAQSNKVIK